MEDTAVAVERCGLSLAAMHTPGATGSGRKAARASSLSLLFRERGGIPGTAGEVWNLRYELKGRSEQSVHDRISGR